MKIIQKAKRLDIVRITCNNCHSVLEVEREDVTVTTGRGCNDTTYTCTCPVCNDIIYNKQLKLLFEYYVDE